MAHARSVGVERDGIACHERDEQKQKMLPTPHPPLWSKVALLRAERGARVMFIIFRIPPYSGVW